MTPQKVIIDCDPGADDAIALLLALAHPQALEILAVTTVAGNVPLALTQTNARRICELANHAHIPVYAGCPRPLLRPLILPKTCMAKRVWMVSACQSQRCRCNHNMQSRF